MNKKHFYSYDDIVEYAKKEGFGLKEFGEQLVGEFIVSIKKHTGYGLVATFIMVSLNKYECVYSDVGD